MKKPQPTYYEADFSGFGYKEIFDAAELLKEYGENGCKFLADGIKVGFNVNSGFVFLTDEHYNVAMFNEGKLAQFFNCSNCGAEGFKEDIKHSGACERIQSSTLTG